MIPIAGPRCVGARRDPPPNSAIRACDLLRALTVSSDTYSYRVGDLRWCNLLKTLHDKDPKAYEVLYAQPDVVGELHLTSLAPTSTGQGR